MWGSLKTVAPRSFLFTLELVHQTSAIRDHCHAGVPVSCGPDSEQISAVTLFVSPLARFWGGGLPSAPFSDGCKNPLILGLSDLFSRGCDQWPPCATRVGLETSDSHPPRFTPTRAPVSRSRLCPHRPLEGVGRGRGQVIAGHRTHCSMKPASFVGLGCDFLTSE